MLKDQLENDELKEKIGFIEKSLNESLKNLENENKRLKEIIVNKWKIKNIQ